MTKRKSLSYLIEAELEKATVLLAAQAITDRLQKIAEELAKMDANDVMPLGDSMRDLFGSEQATSFEQAVSEKISGLVDQVRDAKNAIADQIEALKNGTPMNDMAQTDSHEDMFPKEDGQDASAGLGGDDVSGAAAPEGDDADPFGMGGEGHDDADFGGDKVAPDFDMGGAAGRPQKESYRSGKKVLESADRRLTKQFSRLIREGKSAGEAAHMLAESYAIDVSTVVKIITKTKKG